MMMDDLVLQNPVLVKHLRSRLRPQHLIPLVLMVAAICACITWASMAGEDPRGGLMGLITFQGLLLFLVGSSAVAAAVSTARESGMLDFHRISPQRPLALSLGFLLGAPVREFVLFACTLPFALVLAAQADHTLLPWLAVTADLLLLSPLYYAIAILAGLALPKRTSSTTLTLMLIIFLHMGWMMQAAGSLTIIPLTAALGKDAATTAPHINTTILGYPAPALLVCLLHQLPILVFLLVAITRKMRHELAYPLTKLDAISFYSVMALLLLSDAPAGLAMLDSSPHGGSPELGGIALTYGLALLGCVFVALVTPDAGAFARAVRHAVEAGVLAAIQLGGTSREPSDGRRLRRHLPGRWGRRFYDPAGAARTGHAGHRGCVRGSLRGAVLRPGEAVVRSRVREEQQLLLPVAAVRVLGAAAAHRALIERDCQW